MRLAIARASVFVFLAAGAGGAPVREAVPLAARPFPLTDVRLREGPFREAMRRDEEYLLTLLKVAVDLLESSEVIDANPRHEADGSARHLHFHRRRMLDRSGANKGRGARELLASRALSVGETKEVSGGIREQRLRERMPSAWL